MTVDTKGAFSPSKPERLFEDSTPFWIEGGYDITLDGKRFLMMEEVEKGASQIIVKLNWFEELKRVAPAK